MKHLSLIICLICLLGITSNSLSAMYPPAEMERKLTILKDSGFVCRVEPEYNVAYVETSLWNAADYTLKKNISAFLANYCGWKKGTDLYHVEIRDKYTGKKLAKYSQAWGFKVY